MAAAWLALAAAAAAGASPPARPGIAVEIPAGAAFLTPDGRVHVVGYNDMRNMLESLAGRFSSEWPAVSFELDLRGTRYAPAALASGTSAFAPMGAVFTPEQLADYRRVQPRDPACFRVAHASVDPAALSGPLAVFVHTSNPLPSLSLEQLQGVFAGTIRRWGELGLGGAWSARPISVYGLREGTALRHEFAALVMRERAIAPSVTGLAQSADVAARVAADPDGIGFAAAMRLTPGARLVPLGARPGEAVLPTRSSLVEGRYPLDRFLYLCTTQPMPSVAREFVALALSPEGQQLVAATPQRYLPLSARELDVERTRLAQSSLESSSAASAALNGK